MTDYVIVGESGAHCLVSAESAITAEQDWDRDVAKGNAEPRNPHVPTRRANRADIIECTDNGHDYR